MTGEGESARVAEVRTVAELAALLRQLRRREARERAGSELTVREVAAKTGWSTGVISDYLSGKVLPPTDRFDTLIALLGATRTEKGTLATARDRVEEFRRATGAADRPVPVRQLPPPVAHFAGRGADLDLLNDLLDRADQPDATVVIAAIGGTAGIGKTALAVHWAHRVSHRFPDGQLYANLRGFDPSAAPVAPRQALRGFLEALHVAPARIPASQEAQTGLYRSLLAGQRILVLLDNALDADQVQPLLPATAGCLVLITSRNQLTSLVAEQAAQPVVLDLLTDGDALDLLAGRLGTARVAAEPRAAAQLLAACARLPLALALVAAQAAAHPGFALRTFAETLGHANGRLDALAGGEATTDVRAVFSWSYRTLAPAPARLFRLLGLHPGPDISMAAAASLAALPPAQVRPALAELTRVHLIVEHVPGRYSFHDLLRAYAAEQAHAVELDALCHAAMHRMLDHYLHTAHTAAHLLQPSRDPIILAPPEPGVTPEHPTDYEAALTWFSTERPALLAVLDSAVQHGFDTHAWQLAWTFRTYLDRCGHWHDWAATQYAALGAAQRLGDPSAQALSHRYLAHAYTWLNRLEDAHAHLSCALDLQRTTHDQNGQGRTHLNLAEALERQGHYVDSLDHAQQALHLGQATGDKGVQANALNAIGWCHSRLGDHSQALIYCRQALALFGELDNRSGQAVTWDSLGYAHRLLGQLADALSCYQRAVDLFGDLGDRYSQTITLTHMGEAHDGTDNPTAARAAWQHALTILEDLDHPDAEQVRARLLELAPDVDTSPE